VVPIPAGGVVDLARKAHEELGERLDPDDEAIAFLRRMKSSALKAVSYTRLESLRRLSELGGWLYVYERDSEVMSLGRALLTYPFDGDFTRYGPVESVLALAAWTARDCGEVALAEECAAHVRATYGEPGQWTALMREAMGSRLGGHSACGRATPDRGPAEPAGAGRRRVHPDRPRPAPHETHHALGHPLRHRAVRALARRLLRHRLAVRDPDPQGCGAFRCLAAHQ